MPEVDAIYAEIGKRLAELRADVIQEEFANEMGVSRKTLIRYEKGESMPDAGFLARLVKKFGVDVNWLLMGGAAVKPALTPREAALLDNYRHSPEEGKRSLETTSALLAQRKEVKDAG